MEAGLKVVRDSYDKMQTSSMLWMILFIIPVKIYSCFHLRKEKIKWQTIDSRNEEFVRKSNSLIMLLSRTIIVTARKP